MTHQKNLVKHCWTKIKLLAKFVFKVSAFRLDTCMQLLEAFDVVVAVQCTDRGRPATLVRSLSR